MPRTCFVCNKGPLFGHNVSHANNKTRKISRPNLQRIKATVDGNVRKILVCTRCLRSGLVQKAL